VVVWQRILYSAKSGLSKEHSLTMLTRSDHIINNTHYSRVTMCKKYWGSSRSGLSKEYFVLVKIGLRKEYTRDYLGTTTSPKNTQLSQEW